ncbi:MAG: IS66 family insertion sequence element accessory protein TnpB [Fibrobacterales bacterium]
MLSLNPMTKVHICTSPTDMRKSFNSLASMVSELMMKNVTSGDLFVFFNKTKSMVKVLLWDKSGFSIYYKRLEEGTFHLPVFDTDEVNSQEFESSDLLLILKGIELQNSSQHKRFGLQRE